MLIEGRRALLVSLRPRYIRAFLSGTKSVELRRQRVDVQPGAVMVMYASAPTMAVVATASVKLVTYGSKDAIWAENRAELGLTSVEFTQYLQGVDNACAIKIANLKPLSAPIPLSDLRASVHFQPPQSYRFVKSVDPTEIISLVRQHMFPGELQAALFEPT